MRRPPIGALWVRAQVALARDATDRLSAGSALVLAPHPDDETIACGLLLATKVATGAPVAVAVATDGGKGWFSDGPAPSTDDIVRRRHEEWHRGLDALGVPADRRFELGLPDGGLADAGAGLSGRIATLVDELAPSQVFVTAPDDLHPDHRALARATARALGDATGGRPGPDLFAYRVYPAAGLWPGGRPDDPGALASTVRLARSVAEQFGDRALRLRAPAATPAKQRAVAAHVSQERLLHGELRHVWATPVELFRPLEPDVG